MSEPPLFTQNTLREGVIELRVLGEPDPALLPSPGSSATPRRERSAPVARARSRMGPTKVPSDCERRSHERLTELEGHDVTPGGLLVTGGNSQALDQAMTMLTKPGDVVYVECPTYNLALGIIADHPVTIAGVALDDQGLDVDALEVAVREARCGRPPAPRLLLHTIPTLPQPGGRQPSQPPARGAAPRTRSAPRPRRGWRTTSPTANSF